MRGAQVARNEPCAVAVPVLEVDETDRRQTAKGQFLGQQQCPSWDPRASPASQHTCRRPCVCDAGADSKSKSVPFPQLGEQGVPHSVSVMLLFAYTEGALGGRV